MSFAQITQTPGTNQYSVPSSTALPNCYFWTVTSPLTIPGSKTTDAVTLSGTGTGTLTLTYFANGTCNTISKNVLVGTNICSFNPTTIAFNFSSVDPYIVNFSVGPTSISPISSVLSYAWTFTYATSTTPPIPGANLLTSAEEKPSFEIDCNKPMTSAKVVITKVGCTPNKITLTKSWNSKFGGICNLIFAPKISNENDDEVKLQPMNNIKVSPNPTSSTINFNGENLDRYKVSIFDDHGNEVVRNTALDGEISIEGHKQGLYFYRITDEKGLIQEGKLIKE